MYWSEPLSGLSKFVMPQLLSIYIIYVCVFLRHSQVSRHHVVQEREEQAPGPQIPFKDRMKFDIVDGFDPSRSRLAVGISRGPGTPFFMQS